MCTHSCHWHIHNNYVRVEAVYTNLSNFASFIQSLNMYNRFPEPGPCGGVMGPLRSTVISSCLSLGNSGTLGHMMRAQISALGRVTAQKRRVGGESPKGPIVSTCGGWDDLLARWPMRLAAKKRKEHVHRERDRVSEVVIMCADTWRQDKVFYFILFIYVYF